MKDAVNLFEDASHTARLEESAQSAAAVIPTLIELFPWVTSVVDVGCGTGAWLHQFQLHGIPRVLGVDAANVPRQLLQIAPSDFRQIDCREPLPLLGRFDLTISLEFADRLPDEIAGSFVTGLTRLSDLVVFSAAVPGQSTDPVLNERWPSYWVAQFAANRFRYFDILRERLWYDQRVGWPYAQNMLVFVAEAREDLVERLSSIHRHEPPVDIVHPRAFELVRSQLASGGAPTFLFYPFALVEEGYEGHNILQIDVDKFLALAQSEGAYSPSRLATGGYRSAVVAPSVEAVKQKIARADQTKMPRRETQKRRDPALTRLVFPVRLVEEGYKGFNILQIDANEFLALAQSEGAYSPEKLAAGGYQQAYIAASPKEAKRLIKQARASD